MQMDLARQLEQLNREMDEQLLADLQVQLVSCSNDVTLVTRESSPGTGKDERRLFSQAMDVAFLVVWIR